MNSIIYIIVENKEFLEERSQCSAGKLMTHVRRS